MNEELLRAWEEAGANPGEPIDLGRNVVCDFCSVDHTNSEARGGVIFGSYAICPRCVPAVESEPWRIRARCPAGMRFGDFVRNYRGDNNTVTIYL